jgi:ATP-dependent Clp protease ATP-binding subunit ClpB
MSLELTEAAKELIAREGFDAVYGARPLKRTIQKDLVQPLAVRMLQGQFVDGDNIVVDVGPDNSLTFNEAPAPVPA